MIDAQAIAAALKGRANGQGWKAKCPAHDDSTPSLSISVGEDGKPLIRCHAGCSQESVIDALRERGLWPAPTGITVADLAAAKHLPESLLRESGFADDTVGGRSVIRMDYRGADNEITCRRYRGSLSNGAGPRFWFERGHKQQLYGLWRLRRAESVLLVEGETDCLALWCEDFNAVGVPGAEAWHDSRFAPQLADCTLIYAHIEPDEGGKKFRERLERSSLRQRLRFFTVPNGAKDPCELRARNPTAFRAAIRLAMSKAETINKDDEPQAPAPSPLVLRSAAQIAADVQPAVWLIKRLVERNALLLMYGELGSLKSFLALDWALQIADNDEPVVYLHAEGRGLWKRLRAWAMTRYPDTPWTQTLDRLPFRALERPINLSADDMVALLIEAITTAGIWPSLIVVDTMSRNSDGTVERSNDDAIQYLNRLDGALRARYGCSILLVHHVGHVEKGRPRGPYSLMANTDAPYLLERLDMAKLEMVVRFGRMKDCEAPPPLQYAADVVPLDELEDGQQVTSLVLRPTGAPVPSEQTRQRKAGKNQIAAINALAEWARSHANTPIISSEELKAVMEAQGLKDRKRRAEVTHKLEEQGLLTPSVAGHKVNHHSLSLCPRFL